MTARTWRELALTLVEQAAAAESRGEVLREMFTTVDRHLGIDSASVATLAEHELRTWNKPAICTEMWQLRADRYLREGMPLVAAAAGSDGVVQDIDVLTRTERSRSAFYAEYLRPLGASSFALLVVRCRGVASHLVSFSRHGRSAFRRRDLELLRAVAPSLSLVARFRPHRESPVEKPAAAGPARGSRSAPPQLTRREAEIAEYVSRGLRNPEIAALCGSSPFTVRNQLASIFRKLDVSTRAELVRCWLELGAG